MAIGRALDADQPLPRRAAGGDVRDVRHEQCLGAKDALGQERMQSATPFLKGFRWISAHVWREKSTLSIA